MTPDMLPAGIASRVAVDASGCWLWLGSRGHNGYGLTHVAGRTSRVHRVAYEILVGPIPDGLPLDHLCSVRHCLAPTHLEPVTTRENVRRANARRPARKAKIPIARVPLLRDACRAGHPMSGENLSIRRRGSSGETRRVCLACERLSRRRYSSRLRAKRAK